MFISQLGDRSQPLNKNLHKGTTCVWKKSLTQIKEYFTKSPILIPPILRKPLILYISATNTSLGALLAHHDENGKE